MLDIEIGVGDRRYRDLPGLTGSRAIPARREQLNSLSDRFDVVLALSYEREACLAAVDAERPYAPADLLLEAAERLEPGGTLVWSYLYPFSDGNTVHSLLEPAAIYRALLLRGFADSDMEGRSKLHIYQDPDTLFVHHKAVLAFSPRHVRIARVLCALTKPAAVTQDTRQRGLIARLFGRHVAR